MSDAESEHSVKHSPSKDAVMELPEKGSPIKEAKYTDTDKDLPESTSKEQININIPDNDDREHGETQSAKESLLESPKTNGNLKSNNEKECGDIASPSSQIVDNESEPLDKRKGWRDHVQFVKKNESIVLMAGLIVFLLGCIFLAVGAFMMQSSCTTASQDPEVFESPKNSSAIRFPHLDIVAPTLLPHSVSQNGASYKNASSGAEPLNLALGRIAKQSSTSISDGFSFGADLAVDGNLSSYKFMRHSCSQTVSEAHPSWVVELASMELVKRVKIILPTDCCIGDLHNFELRIGQQEDFSLNSLCRYYMGTALRDTLNLQCEPPIYGRFVSIEVLGDDTRPRNVLTLCEVQVFT